MRKLSFFVLLSASLVASAQSKIDFSGRMVIEQVKELQLAAGTVEGENTMTTLSAAADAANRSYTVVVEFVDNVDYGDVAVEELSSLGRYAVVSVTALQMEQLAELPQVKQIALGYEKNPAMYVARPACGVDAVQAGSDGLGKQYTGKGVVAGLFDVGLDVNHINFLDAEGEPRTKALWVYNSSGRESAYTTVSQIKNFTTENSSETHGTHVLGIMAGGYNGPAKYAVIGGATGQKVEFTKQDAAGSAIPFYGVATESDLAVACGPLYDGNILAGVQRIVRYAESSKQPCVVNISIGSTLGPHDGTDATSKYLAELGKKAIICIAAGNEGDENISIAAGYGEPVQTFVKNATSGAATIQFWGSDDVPFTLRFIAYDRSKGKEVFSYTLDENLAGKSVRQSDMTGFNTALSGNISMSSNIDPSNNRYNVSVTMNVSGISSTIAAGFSIEPLDNQMVEGFAHNSEFASNSVPGFVSGNPDNSISSMACGENVIVVGSFTTAAQWATFNASGSGAYINSYSPRPAVGAISSFSSYGTTFAGKSLPDIAAPGEGIISSYSQYYVKNAPTSSTQGWMAGEYTSPDDDLMSRNSPWGLMQGTSMACPFVAGVIATWLEADPSLKYEDVMNIINNSAKNDFYTMDWPERFGAGKIDALAGIKEVIAGSGISDVAADDKGLFVTDLDGRNFEIYVPGAGKVAASLYSLAGNCVAGATASGNTVNLGAENVVPGVYVIKVSADNNSGTKKIIIR